MLRQHSGSTQDVNTASTHEFRPAPHNIEAEQALLGAILVENEVVDKVAEIVGPDHFFDPLHAAIYDASVKLVQMGKTVNPVTLRTYFENSAPIAEHMSVPAYLARLAASATTIISAEDYARTILDLATRRQLILLGEDLVNAAYDAPVDNPPEVQIEEATDRLFRLGHRILRRVERTLGEAVTDAIVTANKAYQNAGGMTGVTTGIKSLDDKLGGLQDTDLIVLAGRPSAGKTALALNLALAAAKSFADEAKGGKARHVAFWSLEMSDEQLGNRAVSAESELSSERIRRGMLDEPEFMRLRDAAQALAPLPMIIDQTGGISIGTLAVRARRMKRQHNVGLIVVDYLQLMQASNRRPGESRVQEITEITTGLKALAKELKVPVLALSQLSRSVEQRSDKRPQLSDLRESGSIEQDADTVLFVFREEYYVAREEPPVTDAEAYAKWQVEMLRVQGKAEIIIGKQRHGAIGNILLGFDAKLTRFVDLGEIPGV